MHIPLAVPDCRVAHLVERHDDLCQCPTHPLPSGSASTIGRSGRAAVTARSSSTATVAASSISPRISRHPRWLTGSNGIPASNSSPGATEPAASLWLDCSSRPARARLHPQHTGAGSGRIEPDAMAGHLRRGPPAACRQRAAARDRPCHGAGACDGAQVRECRDVPSTAASRCWPSLLDPHVAYLAGRIDEGCGTRWPCGARSGNGAIPGRAGRATASSPSAGRGRSDQAAPSGRGPACIAAARHGSSSAARTANGVVARPAPPQGGLRAMQPWCGPQGRAGPSLMIRMRTPQRTSPPGSRKHGAATLLPSRRSPRDWRRISRPSGLLSRSHGVAARRKAGSTDSSSSSASRARCSADRDQRPRQRGDRGLGRIDRGISDPAALLRGRPALGDGNGAGRTRGADGDGGAPLRRWSRLYPASASSRSASTWAARWSASRSSTRSITAS